MSTVTIECTECGRGQSYPTAMPEDGSILHHTSLIGTLEMLFDATHLCMNTHTEEE